MGEIFLETVQVKKPVEVEVEGAEQVTLNKETYTIAKVIADEIDKMARWHEKGIVIGAKMRIQTGEPIPYAMQQAMVQRWGKWIVTEIALRNPYISPNSNKQNSEIVISHGEISLTANFSTYFSVDYDIKLEENIKQLKGRTFEEIFNVLTNLHNVPFNGFDQITMISLRDDHDKVVFGCKNDCNLNFQYSTRQEDYDWVPKQCEEHNLDAEVKGCFRKRRPQTTYVSETRETGEYVDGDYECSL